MTYIHLLHHHHFDHHDHKLIITRWRVDGLLRPKSTSPTTCRHSKTFIIINTIVITMVGGKIDDILRPTSNTSTATHFEINCLSIVLSWNIVGKSLISVLLRLEENYFNIFTADRFCVTLLVFSMDLGTRLRQGKGINYFRDLTVLGGRVSMKSGTRDKWLRTICCFYWRVLLHYWRSPRKFLLAGFVGSRWA